MTTTPRRFVIEACDDHDRTRAVVCTINVHIVVASNRWCATVGNRDGSHHSLLGVGGGQSGERGMPPLGTSGAPLAVTVIAECLRTSHVRLRWSSGLPAHWRLTVCPLGGSACGTRRAGHRAARPSRCRRSGGGDAPACHRRSSLRPSGCGRLFLHVAAWGRLDLVVLVVARRV